MKNLPNAQDPTGFFNFLRSVARMMYGDPRGFVQGRGRIEHGTKKGPGRRRVHQSAAPAGTKLARKARRLGHGRGL
jgi:hypothetical protein